MNMEFIEAIHELEKEKGISTEILFEAIEAALISAYKKNFSSLQNVRIHIDRLNGEIKVYARKNVVEIADDPRTQISLEEAKKMDPNYSTEDIVEFEVTPRDFGRIAAQTAKQVVVQRIREAERGLIYDEYINREGDIVTGIVQRYEQRNVIVDLGKVEAVLPASEQNPGVNYQPFERIKAYVVEVKKTTKGPQILLSRTHPGLIKRLFELEVPEIHDGIVEIKAVAREAGARSKIAVYSKDKNVDPVGACVGPKGSRVQNIVNELKGEKMDIINWSADPIDFVSNALSPARVLGVYPRYEDKVTLVVVPDYQLSLAIGKEGQNARLAAKLTGWKIDIKNETQALAQNLIPEDSYQDEEYESEYYEQAYEPYEEGEYTDYEDEPYGDYVEGEYEESEEEYQEYDEGYQDYTEEGYDEYGDGSYQEDEDSQYYDEYDESAEYDGDENAPNENSDADVSYSELESPANEASQVDEQQEAEKPKKKAKSSSKKK
ncbi:transcription termination factor NusA [Dehalobacter sp. TBBPA1]|uniref:transcription termination factor NusA n=1 Tax=Dehalobacter sp. TBBPA1 TaxID=3235037 RepID=UPI0034A46F17